MRFSGLFVLLFCVCVTSTDLRDSLFRLALHILNERGNETAVVSPYSVAITLAMVNVGAKGSTRQEVADFVFDGHTQVEINSWFNRSLMSPNFADFSMSSNVYVDDQVDVLESHKSALINCFNATIKVDNSIRDPHFMDGLINYINATIPEIHSMAYSSENAYLLTSNAGNLKVKFRDPFYPSERGYFEGDDGTVRQVELMLRRTKGHFYQLDDYVFASFPFLEGEMDFFLIVPINQNLNDLKDQFLNSTYRITSPPTRKRFVQDLFVTMPKFKVQSRSELSGLLARLGLDYLGPIFENTVRIDRLVHKAVLDITELGISISPSQEDPIDEIAPLKPCFYSCERHVYADRSFLYGVLKEGIPLLVGQYV